jgi:hypothetical protein
MNAAAGEGYMTPRQLKKIWAGARELGWDDVQLHGELERVIGITSLRDLTLKQAKLMIDYMVSLGVSSGRQFSPSCQVDGQRREARPDNVIELATPAQQQFIDELLGQAGWTRETPYFLGCLKKGIARTTIRTRKEASVAITILQKLTARQQAGAFDAFDPRLGA